MVDFFAKLFNSDFMPHGHCFLWQPGIVWLHVVSDLTIFLSYFLIPFGLVQLVRKRRDLEFNWMYLMFGLFILSCGLTHAMNVWDIWHATYRLEGLIKAITALASLSTAVLLFRLIPVALTIPSPEQLRKEIGERKNAELAVRKMNEELEKRVNERTASLRRSNQALQRFAYIASHDLQEPVRTIRSMNQLIARDYQASLDNKANTYLDFVSKASDRMQSLLMDLLDYAMVLDQGAPRNRQIVDTTALVKGILDDLHIAIEDSGATIVCRDLPAIYADPKQVSQIFVNLLTNGMKYVRPGQTPRVEISARCGNDVDSDEANQDAFCTFCVKDNGIGIEEQYQKSIFVAFRRLHGREFPGSGVGLTICKDIVEEYKGRIWVQSENGAGSTFFFTLPAAEVANERSRLVAHQHSGVF